MTPALSRSLQRRHVSMIAVGGTISAGLLVSSGTAIAAAGPAILVSYLLTGGLILQVIRMLGEMAPHGQPLTAISTNTEASLLWLARSPPDFGEIQELCTRNLAEVQRAVDVIQRIRSMAIRETPERQRENLNAIVADALPFLRPELQRREVTLCLEPAPRLPDVLADRIQLQQVFVNLALNAVQAMSQGDRAKRLTIRTAHVDESGVLAEIDDTGPGVSAGHMANLFQSFFTTKKGGMGMGLSICRYIVEAHGGYIQALNLEAEAGARFRFTLPASPS